MGLGPRALREGGQAPVSIGLLEGTRSPGLDGGGVSPISLGYLVCLLEGSQSDGVLCVGRLAGGAPILGLGEGWCPPWRWAWWRGPSLRAWGLGQRPQFRLACWRCPSPRAPRAGQCSMWQWAVSHVAVGLAEGAGSSGTEGLGEVWGARGLDREN